jgi:hypothetical protein
MNQTEIKCACGATGWLNIEDMPYVEECPCCGQKYTVYPDGTTEKLVN